MKIKFAGHQKSSLIPHYPAVDAAKLLAFAQMARTNLQLNAGKGNMAAIFQVFRLKKTLLTQEN